MHGIKAQLTWPQNNQNSARSGQVSAGQANRFATPAIYGNLVLVPTLTGVVFVRTS